MAITTDTLTRRRGPKSRAEHCAEAQAHYGAHTPWWGLSTPEERLAALEAKLDREQPLPTYSHGRR